MPNLSLFACHSASTFQRVMDNVFSGLPNERSLVYMNDIILYSATIHVHPARLTVADKRLRNAYLKIQFPKCECLFKKFAYLRTCHHQRQKEIIYVANNLYNIIIEMLCKCCQNIGNTPGKDEISLIPDHHHNGVTYTAVSMKQYDESKKDSLTKRSKIL